MLKIEKERRLHRFTYDELAEFCGVTKQAIFAICNGKNDPSFKLAMKLANFFKIPVEELFSKVIISTPIDNDNSNNNNNISEELLTAKEVSQVIFKNKVSYSQIIALAHRGEIPFLKIGTKYFFLKSKILDFIKNSIQPIRFSEAHRATKMRCDISAIAGMSKID